MLFEIAISSIIFLPGLLFFLLKPISDHNKDRRIRSSESNEVVIRKHRKNSAWYFDVALA